MQALKLVPNTQVDVLAQLIEEQGRRLRELEIRLQKEKQEKANLEIDFQHLLDQLNSICPMPFMHDDTAVVCG